MLKVISPFGPKIAKLKFPIKLIDKINTEVDRIISNKLLANKLDYSKKLVGKAGNFFTKIIYQKKLRKNYFKKYKRIHQ